MSYGGGEREEDRALGYKQSVMEQQRGEAGTPPRLERKRSREAYNCQVRGDSRLFAGVPPGRTQGPSQLCLPSDAFGGSSTCLCSSMSGETRRLGVTRHRGWVI